MALADLSQTFYVDPSWGGGASQSWITRLDLYFRTKPSANNNSSGINNPGASLMLLPCVDGTDPAVPDLTLAPFATPVRVQYDQIGTSNDCSVPTRFAWPNPMPLQLGKVYAAVLSLDGSDPAWNVFTCRSGDPLVNGGGNAPAPSSSQYFLKLFGPPSVVPTINGAANGSANTANLSFTASWHPVSNTALTVRVHAARFKIAGAPVNATSNNITANTSNTVSNGSVNVSANAVTNTTGANLLFSPAGLVMDANGVAHLRVPTDPHEYLTFDRKTSTFPTLVIGERVYANTFYWPGGSQTKTNVAITNASTVITAPAGFDWQTVFTFSNSQAEWVVVESMNQYGNAQHGAAARRVASLGSTNNVLNVTQPLPFTNASANFMKTVTGRVYTSGQVQHFGALKDVVVLTDSSANDSVRFVNDSVTSISFTTTGSTGYSNSDYITVTGYESVSGKVVGGYSATANIVTFANGSVSNVCMSNLGAGFVNVSAAVISVTNSTGFPATGTGGGFTAQTGSVAKGEFLNGVGTGGILRGVNVINMPVHFVIPSLAKYIDPGAHADVSQEWRYYQRSDSTTISGEVYYAANQVINTHSQDNTLTRIPLSLPQPTVPSRSNEYIIPWDSTGVASNASANNTGQAVIDIGASNSSVIAINVTSNSDFNTMAVAASNSMITMGRFIYNFDYTNENTDSGNSWSKYISKTISLIGNGAIAEDCIAYLSAHRPANTDIQVFVRMKNIQDGDSFSDKDWSRLVVNASTANIVSSASDYTDYADFQYTLPMYPNSAFTLSGTVTTTSNSATITGSNTTWQTNATANVVAGDLVKVWAPLFPNNYMVTVVSSVANDTSLVLGEAVTNVGVVGTGLKIDKIAYPKQAYRDALQSNVMTYWTSGGQKVQGFDQFAVKICLLGANDSIYPCVKDARVLAVSA